MTKILWKSPLETLEYAPVYLANGAFGGMVDLSGSCMNLWNSRITAKPIGQEATTEAEYPVTALRIQAYYRNAYWKEAGFWIGRSGIHCQDPNYTSHPGIPHVPQVYHCHQELDLAAGDLCTKGALYLGSQAALEAGLNPEQALPFTCRMAFLKNSTQMGVDLHAADDTEILFLPEPILNEGLTLDNSRKSIHTLGNELSCDLRFSQTIESSVAEAGRITYRIRPGDGECYRVIVRAKDAEIETLNGISGFVAKGRLFCSVEILADATETEAGELLIAEAFFAEQAQRWAKFWAKSSITLPDSEPLWQERYAASLFYVEQSMGDAPIHPPGLSKPMLPYWYGCFHDTDTYFCRPLLETGHFDSAALHLNFRHRMLESACKLAQEHDRSGAMYPWQCDPKGGGELCEVPINSAIIAIEAWHQHCYSGTQDTLIKARDILSETLRNLADLLDLDARPLRLKPEPIMTFSETMTATDPSEVRIGLRSVANSLLQSGVKDDTLVPLAERITKELEIPFHPDGFHAFGGDKEPEYLRCPSLLLGSFPLHSLPADSALQKTFDHEIARIIYLFAWLPHQASFVASQLGRRNGATSASTLLRNADVFYKPWHAYDEWENRRTARAATFVTAAGGFCTAIHAMLLAETASDIWSLFPGIPEDWNTLEFKSLHTRHGWRISARLKGGELVHYEAEPTHDKAAPECVLRFKEQTFHFPTK